MSLLPTNRLGTVAEAVELADALVKQFRDYVAQFATNAAPVRLPSAKTDDV